MIVNINNVDIYYEKSGNGKPLILLHGNGETHKIFHKAIQLLQEHFTVYAVDLRGHGNSSKIQEYHYLDMANDIKCFIESEKIESPILFGFSDGGIIGLLLASKYPRLFSQLIVSGANLNPKGIRRGWLQVFKIIYKFTKDSKMKMMLQEPNITSEMLQKIEVPTVVTAGSRDMIKEEHTKFIADLIKNSSLKILKGEGHGSYIVNSDKIAKLILEVITLEEFESGLKDK